MGNSLGLHVVYNLTLLFHRSALSSHLSCRRVRTLTFLGISVALWPYDNCGRLERYIILTELIAAHGLPLAPVTALKDLVTFSKVSLQAVM